MENIPGILTVNVPIKDFRSGFNPVYWQGAWDLEWSLLLKHVPVETGLASSYITDYILTNSYLSLSIVFCFCQDSILMCEDRTVKNRHMKLVSVYAYSGSPWLQDEHRTNTNLCTIHNPMYNNSMCCLMKYPIGGPLAKISGKISWEAIQHESCITGRGGCLLKHFPPFSQPWYSPIPWFLSSHQIPLVLPSVAIPASGSCVLLSILASKLFTDADVREDHLFPGY